MNSYILVAVVLYTAWAIYSGYKYVNGRYPWLEQPEIAHRICSGIENGRSQIAEQKGAIKWRTLKL